MFVKFYVVERNGVPAVWQLDPEGVTRQLKRKAGYAVTSDAPSDTRREALVKLRQRFPGSRPLHAQS